MSIAAASAPRLTSHSTKDRFIDPLPSPHDQGRLSARQEHATTVDRPDSQSPWRTNPHRPNADVLCDPGMSKEQLVRLLRFVAEDVEAE
jgi:hypothetical protein